MPSDHRHRSHRRPAESETPPKKKVRFNPVAKTESDHIWLGKTASRTPEKKPSSRSPRHHTSQRKQHVSCAGAPFLVATGLSLVGAAYEAKKERDREREKVTNSRRQPERRERATRPPPTPTRRTPRREDRPRHERSERRPVVMTKDREIVGNGDWAKLRRRTTYVWL